ncbi:hypothetical protein DPMN_090074 [Dreissena polymorpha]|uniref:Uncharacterized protein n=1 Tax=Dreissena polymorpha TaxID=45954 RepID=A0A9D4KY01_DREPO|nr:hypothetical protein DPMN_090074 [Dreissena polymorpha]
MLKDNTGKEVQALHVFVVVIKHFTERVYELLKTQQVGTTSDDVLWTLTVPAIWSDGAKQFMREAASKAGIEDGNLKLVLEPEAASCFCREQEM